MMMFYLQIIGAITGILNVMLLVRANMLNWPIGIFSVALYAFVFYKTHLYSDFLLQIFYFILQAYGWYYWIYGGDKKDDLPMQKISKLQIPLWILIAISGTFVLGFTMQHLTSAQFVYRDAFNTVVSLIAQYWVAKKYLENWLLWILVDALSISIYIRKELLITAGLYSVLLVIATMGFLQWKKAMA